MCLHALLLHKIEMLLFQVLTPSRNSTLPGYSNVRPEMDQISHLHFVLTQICLYYIVARTRKTGVMSRTKHHKH